jgi:hypothetical protein
LIAVLIGERAVSQSEFKQLWFDVYTEPSLKLAKTHLSVCDLTALVLHEQCVAGRVFYNLGAVRQAVNGLAVYNGLHKSHLSGFPL